MELIDTKKRDPGPPPARRDISGPTPWVRRARRLRARRLRDPLGQGVLALSVSLLASWSGLWLLIAGSRAIGAAVLFVATVAVAMYLGLAARAFKRGMTVQTWRDRGRLRLAVSRKEAHLALQSQVLRFVREVDELEEAPHALIEETLGSLVSETHRFLDTAYDDVAVVLALEVAGWYEVLHSAASRRSRWRALRQGKRCRAEASGPEATLARLARYHHAQGISTKFGPLQLVMLSDTAFRQDDLELLDQVVVCMELIAHRWHLSGQVGIPRISIAS